MQNRSIIWIFTILLSLACLYQLSFSWVTSSFEKEAAGYAEAQRDSVVEAIAPQEFAGHQEDSVVQYWEKKYLRDNSATEIYPVFGWTYQECKASEINLGLDLKGGMSVTLEVSIPELIDNLAGYSTDPDYRAAFDAALVAQENSTDNFVNLFEKAYLKQAADANDLIKVFHRYETKEKFPSDKKFADVIGILREESRNAVNGTENILQTRINKFGVSQPSIQKEMGTGRIAIELPGVKDKERVRRVLQSTANLEFWECYNFATREDQQEHQILIESLRDLDVKLSESIAPGFRDSVETIQKAKTDSINAAENDTLTEANLADAGDEILDSVLLTEKEADTTIVADVTDVQDEFEEEELQLDEPEIDEDFGEVDSWQAFLAKPETRFKMSPLFSRLQVTVLSVSEDRRGSVLGFANVSDTSEFNDLIEGELASRILPKNLKLLWAAKPEGDNENLVNMHMIKVTKPDGKPLLDGSVITDAQQTYSQTSEVEVTMKMNPQGAKYWKDYTGKNTGKIVAIVLDNEVQTAPRINTEIPNGISVITGNYQIKEAEDLANILKAGALPAPARIIDESIVGPSLGQENIESGLKSFGIALLVVLLYMIFYYNKAGVVADIALMANLFFIIGVLASLQASLTLPGIAGIILTIGMSVDANVLIFERIREELRSGKGTKAAISDGYSRAYAAIFDANITTLLTAIVLFVFGSGPIKGFATTLMIGIFTSLFAAIILTRLIFSYWLERKANITFSRKLNEKWFLNTNFQFIKKRYFAYALSGVILAVGIGAMVKRGFDYGVEFTGGRTFTARFTEKVETQKIKTSLGNAFDMNDGQDMTPEVKLIKDSYHAKITTNYLVGERSVEADSIVESKLMAGLGEVYNVSDIEILEQRKVDSTVSDDLKSASLWAVGFSLLIIFLYILARFRRWQFGVGALVAVFHDVLIVLSIFSLFYGVFPFSMEIDQAFIAAILTVVGYSINDTVVVFDRIREFLGLYKKREPSEVVNMALNSTLSRTINTSVSTFIVLLIVFMFGGEAIKGFVFALMIGVVVGTYSSLFIATPLTVDLSKDFAGDMERDEKKREEFKKAIETV